MMRENPTTLERFGHHGDNGERTRTRIRCRFWLVALLYQGALHGPSVIVVFEGRFFLKNSARHWASVDEKKNRMRRHTIFSSCGRYYSCHAIVVMTVVTTVATESHMTTHAIFFLIYGCPMSSTNLKKKSYFTHRVRIFVNK